MSLSIEEVIDARVAQALREQPSLTVRDLPVKQLQDILALQWDVDKHVVTQPQIQTATLVNGWIGQAADVAPTYWITNERVVHVVGVADASAATSAIAFNLPVGMRPKADIRLPIHYQAGGAWTPGCASVQGAGPVYLFGVADVLVNADFFNFSFTFHAEQ